MADVTLAITEQLSDMRSNENAYSVTLQNKGPKPIQLLSLVPLIPSAVTLNETKNPSFTTITERRKEMAAELTELLDAVVSSETGALKAKQQEIIDTAMREMFRRTPLYVQIFSSASREKLRQRAMESIHRSKAYGHTIESYHDALEAETAFVAPSNASQAVKNLFHLKSEKLAELEHQTGIGAEKTAIATIQPNSQFSTTYVFTFGRRLVTPRKYNITLEAIFQEEGAAESKQTVTAATSVVISPQPYLLSIIAVLTSVLGLCLKASIDTNMQKAVGRFRTDPAAVVWQMVSAMIVALIFFNVYEFTNLGDRFKMMISWRSALLIGIISGLMEDRVLGALRAFIGGQ